MGLTIFEMEELSEGEILDMIIESANDNADYNEVATQEDFDSVFG